MTDELVEIPKIDSLLLKDLTDEQIKALWQKACKESALTTRRDLSRFIEAMTTVKACQDEIARRGGELARWWFKELTKDFPPGAREQMMREFRDRESKD